MKVISLEGPSKNALSTSQLKRITDELARADGEAVLFTGAGDTFSAGLDLREILALSPAEIAQYLRDLDAFFANVASYPGPTAAAVNGHAIAGGAVLTLCCDHRVLTTNARARIGLNEVPLGLQFPPVILRICRARIAQRSESEVLLGGDLFAPADALRTGLVDQLADDPVAVATARLEVLARSPRESYAACKQELRAAPTAKAASDEAAYTRILGGWSSPELKARLASFLERKK